MVIGGIPAIASGCNTGVKYILDLYLWKPHHVLVPRLVEIRARRSLSLMYLLELDHGAFPLQVAVDLLYIAVLAEVAIQHADHVVVLGQVVHDYGVAFELARADELLLGGLLVEGDRGLVAVGAGQGGLLELLSHGI